MKLYLFAIGGSGARVVKSFVHLLASGSNIPIGTEIVPIIIDTDAKSLETDKLNKTIYKYGEVQRVLFDNNEDYRNSCSFFNTKILTKQFNFESLNLDSTFNKFLNEYEGQPRKLKDDIKNLMDSLYDTSPENSSDTELNLNLNVGFKGNPNIGGIIFNMLENNIDFKNLLGSINATDRVFIISSIFGGNGSSGFPALMNLFKQSELEGLQNAKKAALTVLPYYDLLTDESKENDTSINAKLFNSKSKSALSFYIQDNVLNSLDAHYYVADNKRGQYKYSARGENQNNPATLSEFLGALGILHFLNTSQFNPIENKFGFALDMLGSGAGDNIIHLGHFKKENKVYSHVLKQLISFAFAKKFFDFLCSNENALNPGFKDSSDFYNRSNESYRSVLNTYYEDWQNWIDELENTTSGKRGLKFFEFNREIDELIHNANKYKKLKIRDIEGEVTTSIRASTKQHKPFKYIKAINDYFNVINSPHPSL